jgi:bacillolysin
MATLNHAPISFSGDWLTRLAASLIAIIAALSSLGAAPPSATPPKLKPALAAIIQNQASAATNLAAKGTTSEKLEAGQALIEFLRAARPKTPAAAGPIVTQNQPGPAVPTSDPIRSNDEWVVRKAANGTARQLRRETSGSGPSSRIAQATVIDPERNARTFLADQALALGINDPDSELELESSETDQLGYRNLRFRQMLGGLRVWPTALSVHLAPDGTVQLADASIIPTPLALDRIPRVAADEAVAKAKSRVPGGFAATNSSAELIVYAQLDHPPSLAWKFNVRAGWAHSWTAVIGAQSGDIILLQSDARELVFQGFGPDLAGRLQRFPVWFQNGRFHLVDTTKPSFRPESNPITDPQGVIQILDLFNQLDTNILPILSSSSTLGWSSPDAVSAYVNLGATYDFFYSEFQRNGITGHGDNVTAVVRVGAPAIVASNAFYNEALNLMIFGGAKPFAGSLDVVAHELTHGVTANSARLVYMHQSGALNEAFSDIFGELVENFAYGRNDWAIGSGLPSQLRDMKEPGRLGYPAHFSDYRPSTLAVDNGGVHTNSSIINHAFYQLAEGLPNHLGLSEAGAIFYRCLTVHLQPQSQFVDCRLGCIAAAQALFPTEPDKVKAVADAFDAVGIEDLPPSPSPGFQAAVNAPESALVTYPASTANVYKVARQENALGDEIMGPVWVLTGIGMNRISVSGDGTEFAYVSADNDLCMTSTEHPDRDRYCLERPGIIHSAAISADGSWLAAVLKDPETGPYNSIMLVSKDRSLEVIPLLPGSIEGGEMDSIAFADQLSFSPDSRQLVFDALSETRIQGQPARQTWSIFLLDLETRRTSVLIPPSPDADVGNPVFSHTSADLIALEAKDTNGVSHVVVYNLRTGRGETIGEFPNGICYPEFTGDDRAVIFASTDATARNTGTSLYRRELAEDKMTPAGPPKLWKHDVFRGITYRRGQFKGVNRAPAVALATEPLSEPIRAGSLLTLTASAADPDGAISRVEFWRGSTKLGEDSAPPYSLTFQQFEPGTYRFVARAVDDLGAEADSVPMAIAVQTGLITPPGNQTIAEGQELRLMLGSDTGQSTLQFALLSGPAGLTLTPSGVLTWTPSEQQGPSTNSVRYRVTAGAIAETNLFAVVVTEVNAPPTLTTPPDLAVDEGETVELVLSAVDMDAPSQTLGFALLEGPIGAGVSPAGRFTWTPVETQGPSTNRIVIAVSDGIQQASASFRVTVREVNTAPMFSAIPPLEVQAGGMLNHTLSATDSDFPAQSLRFGLIGGPAGLAVNPNGILSWAPTPSQTPSTNETVVTVTDGEATATNRFAVVVGGEIVPLNPTNVLWSVQAPDALIGVGDLVVVGGKTGVRGLDGTPYWTLTPPAELGVSSIRVLAVADDGAVAAAGYAPNGPERLFIYDEPASGIPRPGAAITLEYQATQIHAVVGNPEHRQVVFSDQDGAGLYQFGKGLLWRSKEISGSRAFLPLSRYLVAQYYINKNGRVDRGVAAYDYNTGNVIWRSEFYFDPVYNSTALSWCGSDILVSQYDRFVFAVNTKSGQELWRRDRWNTYGRGIYSFTSTTFASAYAGLGNSPVMFEYIDTVSGQLASYKEGQIGSAPGDTIWHRNALLQNGGLLNADYEWAGTSNRWKMPEGSSQELVGITGSGRVIYKGYGERFDQIFAIAGSGSPLSADSPSPSRAGTFFRPGSRGYLDADLRTLRPARGLARVSAGELLGIDIFDPGVGYTNRARVNLIGGGGSGAVAEAVMEGDRVISVNMLSRGSGYTNAPTVRFGPPAYPARIAVAEPEVINGFIVGVTVKDRGWGYSRTPAVRLVGGTGQGAQAIATIDDEGQVIGIEVENPGSGYTVPPSVWIEPPVVPVPELTVTQSSGLHFSGLSIGSSYRLQADVGGWVDVGEPFVAQATAVVLHGEQAKAHRLVRLPTSLRASAVLTVVNGFVVGVQVTNPGSGYFTAPNVLVSDSKGTGARIVATVRDGQVIGAAVEVAGRNYSPEATVTIEPPPMDGLVPVVVPELSVHYRNVSTNLPYELQTGASPELLRPVGERFTPSGLTGTFIRPLSDLQEFFRLKYSP